MCQQGAGVRGQNEKHRRRMDRAGITILLTHPKYYCWHICYTTYTFTILLNKFAYTTYTFSQYHFFFYSLHIYCATYMFTILLILFSRNSLLYNVCWYCFHIIHYTTYTIIILLAVLLPCLKDDAPWLAIIEKVNYHTENSLSLGYVQNKSITFRNKQELTVN